jgi:hypothetical protein
MKIYSYLSLFKIKGAVKTPLSLFAFVLFPADARSLRHVKKGGHLAFELTELI